MLKKSQYSSSRGVILIKTCLCVCRGSKLEPITQKKAHAERIPIVSGRLTTYFTSEICFYCTVVEQSYPVILCTVKNIGRSNKVSIRPFTSPIINLRRNWVPPHPQASVAPPFGSEGGKHTRLREMGWGSQF